jgi:hypothetical protein
MDREIPDTRQPAGRPLYQFEFTFTESELKRFYSYFGNRVFLRSARPGESSLWNLYWISNLLLALALAIQTANPLWFFVPVPIVYLIAHLLSARRFTAFGERAIKSGRLTNPVEPLRIEIGEDWVHSSAIDRRIWMAAKLITTFRRVDDFYVLAATDTSIFFPVRIVPTELRAEFEATLVRIARRF